MTEHCQGAEQQQGWLWSVLMLPPVPPYANVPPVPMSGIAIAVGVGAAWVVAVEGAKEIVLPLCLTRRGPLLPASAHPFSFPALGDHACCGTVHICLGTHKEGDLGEASIPPAIPILHLAEEPPHWLEEPAGRPGSQGAAGPSGSPTPAGTAPHALPGFGPHQRCCGTCHL